MRAASSFDKLLTTFTSADDDERVLIVQRPDGHYSYRHQRLDHGCWGQAGPYCGIYDCEHTAEQEAARRVSWLARLRPN